MPAEFFSAFQLPMVTPAGETNKPQCSLCGLYKTCNSPKMKPTGKGKLKVLIVAEAPGKEEDTKGRQLVGNSGRQVSDALAEVGINMRRDCVLTNSLICRPPGNKITNGRWVDYCRPNLINTVLDLKPKVIIVLGGTAMESLGGWLWKKKAYQLGMTEPWVGEAIPAQKINAWVVPTYHPAYLLRQKDEVLDRNYMKHLNMAAELIRANSRPWKKGEIKTFFDPIKVIQNTETALNYLETFIEGNLPVAFDYETNRLKPHGPGARIRCVGISDGDFSVSFELTNSRVINRFKDFLRSDLPKIAHSAKFEEGWSKAVFGIWPKNMTDCTIINTHVLDGRKNITSLKFQSFVKFGVEDYDSHIAPYLVGRGSYGTNKVFDVPTDKILRYCATDAYLEFLLWDKQQGELK